MSRYLVKHNTNNKHYNLDISLSRLTIKHNTNKNYSNYDKIKDYNRIKINLNRGTVLTKKNIITWTKNYFSHFRIKHNTNRKFIII